MNYPLPAAPEFIRPADVAALTASHDALAAAHEEAAALHEQIEALNGQVARLQTRNAKAPALRVYPLTATGSSLTRAELITGLRAVFQRVRLELMESDRNFDAGVFAAASLLWDVGAQFGLNLTEMRAVLGEYAGRFESDVEAEATAGASGSCAPPVARPSGRKQRQ